MTEEEIMKGSGTLEEIRERELAAATPTEPGTPAEPITPAEPAAPTEPVVTATDTFDRFKYLTETTGIEIKSDEDFKTHWSSLTEKTTKFDDLQKQYEQAQNELKAVDPLKFFANQDKYIENQLLIKHPELDPAVLANVLTADVEKADPLKVLTLQKLLKDPKHEIFENEQQAYNKVCKEVGYDKDLPFDEQEEDVKVAIRAARKEALTEFGKFKSEVEVPKPIDLTAEKETQRLQAQANYDKLLPIVQRDLQSIPTGLEKLEITTKDKEGKSEVLFTYDLGEFKNSKVVKDTIAQVQEYTARNAREWTPEVAKKAVEITIADLQKDYIAANLPQILKAYGEQKQKEFMDANFEKENHNRPNTPDPLNPAMLEEQKTQLAKAEQFKKDMGLTGKKTYAH